jgi:hypothetical protein
MTTGCIDSDSSQRQGADYTRAVMEPLPPDFARHIVEVLAPGEEGAAAEVIEAAINLDDARLGTFLSLLAERVRTTSRRITGAELRGLLRESTKHGRPAGT